MRASTSTLHCDDDGGCSAWDLDYYEQCTSSVGEVRITDAVRAPGWTSTAINDWCPRHKPEGKTP